MTSKALKRIVNSPTVKGKATARTAGMHDIGGVPKVDLRDNAMPKDMIVTPRTSKMYLIINFLSILKPFLSIKKNSIPLKPFLPIKKIVFHLNLKGL